MCILRGLSIFCSCGAAGCRCSVQDMVHLAHGVMQQSLVGVHQVPGVVQQVPGVVQ